jgi:hypothetical protein
LKINSSGFREKHPKKPNHSQKTGYVLIFSFFTRQNQGHPGADRPKKGGVQANAARFDPMKNEEAVTV